MITIKSAANVISRLPKGLNVGMTNGCFDILHPGHIRFLERARSLCSFLLVGINSDSSVEKLKGKPRPFMPHQDRCEIVQALKPVGFAFVFLGLDFTEALTELKPNIWFKSTPWTMETLSRPEVIAARAVGADVLILPTEEDYSSTAIIDKIGRSRLSDDFRYAGCR